MSEALRPCGHPVFEWGQNAATSWCSKCQSDLKLRYRLSAEIHRRCLARKHAKGVCLECNEISTLVTNEGRYIELVNE